MELPTASASKPRSGTGEQKVNAAGALRNLAVNDDNQVTLAAANAIPPLVELVRSGSVEGKANAALALWILAMNVENEVTIAAAGLLD